MRIFQHRQDMQQLMNHSWLQVKPGLLTDYNLQQFQVSHQLAHKYERD